MATENENRPPRRRPRYPRYVDRPSRLADRGYACVALDRPTDPVNVGHALRASFCFGARLVILGNAENKVRISRLLTDPMRTYRHVPVIQTDDILESIPHGCSLICVEMDEAASPLMEFVHPERACYVFGPETGSISRRLLGRCDHTISIPTTASLNLGMTVNVVLYDRVAKAWPKTKARQARLDAARESTTERTNS